MEKGINPRFPRYYKRYYLTNGTVNIIIDEKNSMTNQLIQI